MWAFLDIHVRLFVKVKYILFYISEILVTQFDLPFFFFFFFIFTSAYLFLQLNSTASLHTHQMSFTKSCMTETLSLPMEPPTNPVWKIRVRDNYFSHLLFIYKLL